MLSSKDIHNFYRSVIQFFSTACDYILKNFPLNESLLKHAAVADISKREKASFTSVEFFVKKLPIILKLEELDYLEIEFVRYQSIILPDEITQNKRIDVAQN